MAPCVLCNVDYDVELDDEDDIQVTLISFRIFKNQGPFTLCVCVNILCPRLTVSIIKLAFTAFVITKSDAIVQCE